MAGTVTVRMYHVGFGDCFLVRFPDRDRERLVLIDCGAHSASRDGHELAAVVADVVATATKIVGRPRLDVVVATHAHRDHVHGFREELWTEVEVGEVWLPWTEDPGDAEAMRIKERQSKRAKLLLGLCPADAKGTWEAVKAIAENSDAYRNSLAMAMLHAGFAGQAPRYFLPEPDGRPRSRSFSSDVLPNVTVDVLGPFRNEEAVRDLTPPAGETYLRLDDDAVEPEGRPLPFDRWFVGEKAYLARHDHLVIKNSDLGAIINAGRESPLPLAVALEKAVNGTSLMLVFRHGDVSLLFAGDAQWGTWDRVLADPRAREILKSVDVYKIGHHGSHNATPRRFVEDVVNPKAIGLVPVGATGIPSWSQIPRKPLLKKLAERGLTVIRSDRWKDTQPVGGTLTAPSVRVADDGLWTEVSLPARLEE